MLDTLENVKERLRITDDTYDDFLETQIQFISDVIEAYCRRRFLTATWNQTFYSDENRKTRELILFHYPVQSVTSVTKDGVADGAPVLAKYRLNKPTGYYKAIEGNFFEGTETVIVYVAGYDVCPSPILSVLDSLVQERYNKEKSGVGLNFGSNVQRLSIPGTMSIDYDYTLSSNERKSAYGTILGDYVNVLDDWRSERAILGSGKLEYVEE